MTAIRHPVAIFAAAVLRSSGIVYSWHHAVGIWFAYNDTMFNVMKRNHWPHEIILEWGGGRSYCVGDYTMQSVQEIADQLRSALAGIAAGAITGIPR